MAETVEQVKTADAIMSAAESEKGLAQNSVKLLLLIETALGVRNCYDLIVASKRVESVVFGSGEDGDLQGDLRCKFSSDGPELMYARSKTLLDARAAGLTYVLDGGFTNIKNEDALRLDCTVSRRIGYDGRTLIYPGHIGPAREIYSPDPEEVAYYRGMVTAFEAAVAQGSASIVYGGKLVDYAMLKKAKSFLSAVE
jgi:citrate lyase subunit beta/citryl-CoA lyase